MRSRYLLLGILLCLLTGCGQKDEITWKEPYEPSKLTEEAVTKDSASAQETVDRENGEELSSSGEEPKEQLPVEITISAAGDVTMGGYRGQGYEWSFQQMWEQQNDPAYFFENVEPIFSADDLTIVNLEGPLTTATVFRESQTYCISGDPAYVEALTAGSVEAVSMANNHLMDYYEAGRDDTVAAVEGAGIVYAFNDRVGIYETKGIRIGLISVNVIGYGSGVEKFIKKGMEELKEQQANLILVNCHWGVERENVPEDYARRLGKNCIDWGADLVIGHHPHVIQGIEQYNGKYIVYSLGNFCFGGNRNPADKDCIIFQQTFRFKDGELLEDTSAGIIPCSVSSVTNRNDYKPTPAEGEAYERILGRMNEYSEEFGVSFDEDGVIRTD
ncbi:MAG: CapA family protein [Acetatifactor sp.]